MGPWISKFLKKVQWPTDNETLSSLQYQVLKSWNECLDSLSSLDRVFQKINRHQAVSHLTHIAGETQFQPQTHEEPIQVVGLLESAGMEFDHLWIMGCHAETLPPFPNPNPFLPFLSLQKPFNLPHSTAERELIFTEQTLFRLAHACHHLVFSYPAWQGETEMAPSPLLTPGFRMTIPFRAPLPARCRTIRILRSNWRASRITFRFRFHRKKKNSSGWHPPSQKSGRVPVSRFRHPPPGFPEKGFSRTGYG